MYYSCLPDVILLVVSISSIMMPLPTTALKDLNKDVILIFKTQSQAKLVLPPTVGEPVRLGVEDPFAAHN
jgi:hypothetical protein